MQIRVYCAKNKADIGRKPKIFAQNHTRALSDMLQPLRHQELLSCLREAGYARAEELAGRLGVTVQTIRRDLTELAELGALERVHGGAVLPSGVAHVNRLARAQVNAGAKARIGAAAAGLVPDKASVFLGIGTTVEAVARALAARSGLLIVTNNLHVADILGDRPGLELILTGGAMRAADRGLVGPLALRSIEAFRFDIAIMGTSALDETGDLMDFDMAEIQVNQALVHHARATILAADHSKFRRTAPFRVGAIRDFTRFVTDAAPPAPLAEALADWPTRLILAQ